MHLKRLLAALVAFASAVACAEEQTVAYLADNGNANDQWISTGVRFTGDARKVNTREIWVYPLSRGQQNLFEQYGGNAGRETFQITSGVSGGYVSMHMNGYDPPPSVVSAHQVPLNQWTHIALVIDGDVWRIYVNGELDGESSGHATHLQDATSADGFVIGNSRSSTPNGHANAYFAEARLWTTARTQAQIREFMRVRLREPWRNPDLLGYWPLNDGAAAYEANGNMVRDYASMSNAYSPGGNTWNYHYAKCQRVSWVTSDLPVAGSLPSVDQAVYHNAGVMTNAVDTLVNATPRNFTVMGWYNVAVSAPNRVNYLFGKSMAGNGRAQFYENNGSLKFWMGGGSGGATNEEYTAVGVMPLARWTHVAVVKDGTVIRIYVNGELVGESGGFTMNLLNQNLHLGGFFAGGSQGGYYGQMRNIGFWSRALKPDAIHERMYKLPRPTEGGLLGYWPLDDGAGDAPRNLKEGAPAAIPLEKGFLRWIKGVNMPVPEGAIPAPGMTMAVH